MALSFEISHLLQPKGSNQCGQTCVAMLLGTSVEKACELVGTKGKTETFQLVHALREGGVRCADRRYRCRFHYDLPSIAILFGRVYAYGEFTPKCAHWMLWYNHQILDPEGVVPRVAIEELRHDYNIRLTSYLCIYGKKSNEPG